jgi:peptide/nickel transport system substrate-binding protein
MTQFHFQPSRRQFLAGVAIATVLPSLPAFAADTPKRGGTLTIVTSGGPTYLNSALSTAGAEALISPKYYEGLLDYDTGMKPKAQLATSWSVTPDGKRITFKLREGVKWHDGQPFTSKDVKVSLMEILKIHHGRGRASFADLTEVETPDDLTATLVLNKPSASIMYVFNASESPIMPAHLYGGTNILENPANMKPVGTGAYRFVSYTRGETLVTERNPDYWDKGRPYVDRLVVRFIPDGATRTAMLESGEADFVVSGQLPMADIMRLDGEDGFEVVRAGYETTPSQHVMEFNMRKPLFQNKLVRHAIAHAMDKDWINENIWYGYGHPGTGPLHVVQKSFYTTDGVPAYEYDLKKAEALLDQAGYKRGADGTRFAISIDATAYGEAPLRTAEYMREQLREIGVKVEVRVTDPGGFAKRIYGERDFDISTFWGSAGADPAIGVQRFYWSKNIKDGVAYSNGSCYSNPEVDKLLEDAAVELDFDKRYALYKKFQQIVMEDLPTIPVNSVDTLTISRTEVKDHTTGAIGGFGTMAQAWLDR